MKILHIMSGFEVGYPGGITNYVRALSESQTSHGHMVTILAKSPKLYPAIEKIDHISYDPPRHHVYSYGLKQKLTDDSVLLDSIKLLSPDVIHFHTILALSVNFLNSVIRLGIPYFISVHDYYLFCPRIFMLDRAGNACRKVELAKCNQCVGALDASDYIRVVSKRIGLTIPIVNFGIVEKRVSRLSYFVNNAKKIIAVSHKVEHLFLQAYPDAKTTTMQIGNTSATWERVQKTKSNKIRIAFLGTMNKHKGADLFFEIVKSVSNIDIEFQFYGRADSKYILEMESSGVINNGSYHPDNLKNILSSVDMGMIIPLWEDNGPQVVMEIINSFTPIIATRVGGIPDFVNEKVGYLFNPDVNQEVEKAIEWLNLLTHEKLTELSASIAQLKAPSDHFKELQSIYK